MSEEEFVAMLVKAGWKLEDAKREAHEQYHGWLGDCDGDLEP